MQRWQQADAPGISVAISRDGYTIYERSFGLADIGHSVAIDRDTRFHIASISKQFTAFAIMLLEDEGKLSLDDDIRRHLPDLQMPDPITIRQLLSHSSGLREQNTLMAMIGRSEQDAQTGELFYAMLRRQTGLNFSPGTNREYSNSGYFLLARIVEAVSGQRFSQFARERIFTPLGMQSTLVHDDLADIVPHKALSYSPRGDGYVPAALQSTGYGSTGIMSTTTDLLRWADNFTAQHVGSPDVFAAMEQRTPLAGAKMGDLTNGQELRMYRGLASWAHGGSTGAYRSFLLRIPAQRLSIAVLANRDDLDSARIAYDLADILSGDAPSASAADRQVKATRNPAGFDAFTGTYELFAGTVFSIGHDGKTLQFGANGGEPSMALPELVDRTFLFNAQRDLRFEFRDIVDGKAQTLRYLIGNQGYIDAPRVPDAAARVTEIDPHNLSGRYFSAELNAVFAFELADGTLSVTDAVGQSAELAAFENGVFRPLGQSVAGEMRFAKDSAGTVTGVWISSSLARNIWFSKL